MPSKEGGEIPRPLTKEEILNIVRKYAEAARRAQRMRRPTEQLPPIYNKRTDEFGGSTENRTRFARMILEAVRKQVGPHFPIFLRISADELMEVRNDRFIVKTPQDEIYAPGTGNGCICAACVI